MIQLTLIENVSTEPISQKQMIIENVSKKLDSETKEQVMPLLEAILQAYQNQQQTPSLEDIKEFNQMVKNKASSIKKSISEPTDTNNETGK